MNSIKVNEIVEIKGGVHTWKVKVTEVQDTYIIGPYKMKGETGKLSFDSQEWVEYTGLFEKNDNTLIRRW